MRQRRGSQHRKSQLVDPFKQPLAPLLGEKTANLLAKHLSITTTGQALNYFPRRYIERGELTPVTQLPLGEQVTVIARVVTATRRTMRSRRGFLVDVTVSDESTDTGLVVSQRCTRYRHSGSTTKPITVRTAITMMAITGQLCSAPQRV